MITIIVTPPPVKTGDRGLDVPWIRVQTPRNALTTSSVEQAVAWVRDELPLVVDSVREKLV